jgi:hypothetical protein
LSGFKLQRNASILNPLFAEASDRGSFSFALSANDSQQKEKKSSSASRRLTANSPRTEKPPKPRIFANLFKPKKISQVSENRAAGI